NFCFMASAVGNLQIGELFQGSFVVSKECACTKRRVESPSLRESSLNEALCLIEDASVKLVNASIQRLIKRLLVKSDDILYVLFLGADFGEHVGHGVGEHVHEFVEEWFVEAERAAIAHGAAQDAAQDIVAVGVAGLDAVGNRKAQCADVICNNAKGDVERD